MIKYVAQPTTEQNASNGFITVKEGVMEYTYEGENWERMAFLAKVATGGVQTPHNYEKFFCPDDASLWYWSPSQNTFKQVGWGAVTTV